MTWKGNLTFGNGTQRGAGLTGFHHNGSVGCFSGLLFRGDSRSPTKMIGTGLFKSGFHLHKAGVSVAGRTTAAQAQVHCDHGTTRGVVSATKDVKVACYWAIASLQHTGNTEAWVYAIYIENEVMAADAVYNLNGEQGRDAAVVQAEVMLKDIPGSTIVGARKAAKRGGAGALQNCLIGDVVNNSHYAGANLATNAAAMNDPNWNLFRQTGNQVPCQM